jgi:hypothetical protein
MFAPNLNAPSSDQRLGARGQWLDLVVAFFDAATTMRYTYHALNRRRQILRKIFNAEGAL